MENNHLYEMSAEPEGIQCTEYCSTSECGLGGIHWIRYKTCHEIGGQTYYYNYCDC